MSLSLVSRLGSVKNGDSNLPLPQSLEISEPFARFSPLLLGAGLVGLATYGVSKSVSLSLVSRPVLIPKVESSFLRKFLCLEISEPFARFSPSGMRKSTRIGEYCLEISEPFARFSPHSTSNKIPSSQEGLEISEPFARFSPIVDLVLSGTSYANTSRNQ